MSSSPNPRPTPVLYPAQGTITLLSRAWNLFRVNLKSSILLLLPAVLLSTTVHLLSIQLSGGKVLTQVSMAELGMKLLLAVSLLLLSVPTLFLWVFTACVLSRFFYSAITSETPLPLKSCLGYIQKKWLTISLMTITLGSVSFFLIFLNLFILYLGIILSGALMAYLGFSAGHNLGSHNSILMAIMIVLLLMLWGFLILALLIIILSFQTFFFVFPLMAIANAPEVNTPWWPLVKNSYRLVFANAPRLILFSLAQFFLALVISTVINSPVLIWAGIELSRLGLSRPFQIPLHVQTVINLWSVIASLALMPFYVSAFTLLWYDCQVRQEGLDLVLWFNALLRRQGRQPQEFSTQLTPHH